jgi:hypothetical protein
MRGYAEAEIWGDVTICGRVEVLLSKEDGAETQGGTRIWGFVTSDPLVEADEGKGHSQHLSA